MIKEYLILIHVPRVFLKREEEFIPVKELSIQKGKEICSEFEKKHKLIPMSFQFITEIYNGSVITEYSDDTIFSGHYYLGGRVYTLEELEKINDPKYEILIRNMKLPIFIEKTNKVIINTDTWKWSMPFYKGDIVLD